MAPAEYDRSKASLWTRATCSSFKSADQAERDINDWNSTDSGMAAFASKRLDGSVCAFAGQSRPARVHSRFTSLIIEANLQPNRPRAIEGNTPLSRKIHAVRQRQFGLPMSVQRIGDK